MNREWLDVRPIDVPPALREAVGGHPLVARILALRGFDDPQAALAFLDPDLYVPASPWELPGMDRAAALLRRAVEQGERVRIWGDFDADGQTATAVLLEALRAAGARVDSQLPKRDEGHGLHWRAVEEALGEGISLLITCDTGIGEGDVVRRGVDAGLTVIITDHHDLPATLPPAHAVVNPKLLAPQHSLAELSGVGVAYMVARALLEPDQPRVLQAMLDLVALGLVADVSRQVQDVRYLVQRGLDVLRRTERRGLRALASMASLDLANVNEQDIGFKLGPRLNAAGRLADSELAVRLLLTDDAQEAERLAGQLEALNRDRQARTEAVQAVVDEQLSRDPSLRQQPAIILAGETWEPGVLGLVAGELAKRYDRPAILIGHRQDDLSVGSARSVEGIDIHEAIASQCELLAREGGHPMAAGFVLSREHVESFRRGVLAYLSEQGARRPATPLALDAETPWEEVDLDLAHGLARLAPFGPGNPRPVLALRGGILVRVEDVSRTRETMHRRLYVDNDAGRQLRLIWFNAGGLPLPGDRVDIAFHLGSDVWHEQERLRLEVVDWQPAEETWRRDVATLVSGREIVDWRLQEDVEDCLQRLRERYGAGLALWAEGLAPMPQGAVTRHDLLGQRHPALAILTPPPGPEELRWVLSEAQPQVIYLLPPADVAEVSGNELLESVAGMLRVALRAHEGWIDAVRMSARLGVRRAAVVAALRWLEAQNKVVLRYEGQGLRAYNPGQAPPDIEAANNQHEEEPSVSARQLQVSQVVRSLLDETRAYRRAYAQQPISSLFYAPN